MSRNYCIKCNECLTLEDNLCSITSLDDLKKLIEDIFVMTISWCTHVGDMKVFLRHLCYNLNSHNNYNYSYYFTHLRLTVKNYNYKIMFFYEDFSNYTNYIINNQETLKEIANLLGLSDEDNPSKLIDINTNNEINFSYENLNNYIGRPIKITTCRILFNVPILAKKLISKTETDKSISIKEVMADNDYDSIPDEAIIYIYPCHHLTSLSLDLSKTHELRATPINYYYCARKLYTKTKHALH